MELRAAQRVSGSARTDSQRAESARNPIASHVNFGDDSALSAFTRTQWTAAFRRNHNPAKLYKDTRTNPVLPSFSSESYMAKCQRTGIIERNFLRHDPLQTRERRSDVVGTTHRV